MISLLDAVPYLRAYAGKTFVVKAGGELLLDPRWTRAVARDVALLRTLGIQVVLVHGGGPQLDAAAQAHGLVSQMVAGRRVTTPELIALASEVWVNLAHEWSRALSAHGQPADVVRVSAPGAVHANKRPPVTVKDDDGNEVAVDYGLVGDLTGFDLAAFQAAFANHLIPVVSPLAVDADGNVLNVNADTVAAELAVALGAEKLVLLTRAPGIQRDHRDPSTALHATNLSGLDELEAMGSLKGGMRPKVAAIRRALKGGVPRAHVVDGRRSGALLEEVFTNDGSGTLVVPNAD